MRPFVLQSFPRDGSHDHIPTDLVTIQFGIGIDTTALTQNVAILTPDSTPGTPFTLTYQSNSYSLGIEYPWEAGGNYVIRLAETIKDAVQGLPMGEEYILSFTTYANFIDTPLLLSPPNQTRIIATPDFEWLSPSAATLHDLEVSRSARFDLLDFSTTVATLGGGTLSVTPIDLPSSTNLYWRARGRGGQWTEPNIFYYGVTPTQRPLAPLLINRITPVDTTVRGLMTLVTISCNTTPATPSLDQAYWEVKSSVFEPSIDWADYRWVGEWSVSGNNLVWTPGFAELSANIRYDLQLDELYDIYGRPLQRPTPLGEPVYSVLGLYDPLLVSPDRVDWGCSTGVAGYYLHLASRKAVTLTTSTLVTSILQEFTLVHGRELYMQSKLTGLAPQIGKRVAIGDYEREMTPDAIDGWMKIISQLQARRDVLAETVNPTYGSKTGRRGIRWNPEIDKEDWYSDFKRGVDYNLITWAQVHRPEMIYL